MKNIFDNDITPEDLFLDRDSKSVIYMSGLDNYRQVIFLTILIIGCIGFFWVRLFQLQLGNTKAQDLRQDKLISKNYIKPLRGNIYDRNGLILAYNEVVFSLILKPSLLPEDDLTKNQSIQEVKSFFNLDEGIIQNAIDSNDSEVTL